MTPLHDAILSEVPRRLLDQVKRHLAGLQVFNAGTFYTHCTPFQ